MFGLFNKQYKRIDIQGENIFIDNSNNHIGGAIELQPIISLTQSTPEIKIYENQQLVRLFRIDTLNSNSNLTGQFLNSSIRILSNSAVMIDGIISKNSTSCPKM